MPPIPAHETSLYKLRVRGIISSQLSARDKNAQIYNYVLATEATAGTLFLYTKGDNKVYMIPGATREVLAMPPPPRGGDRAYAYLSNTYGLDRSESAMRVVFDKLRDHAINFGIRVDLRRFAAYDREAKTVYISGYDGYMWRCEGALNGPERILNGEDGVFFIDDDRGTPAENVDVAPHGELLDRLTALNYAKEGLAGITPEQQRKQLIVWMFSLAFPDLIMHKPVLLLEGVKGSGKTTCVQLIQIMLMGREKGMDIDEHGARDFGVVLLRSPIGLLDNQDTYIKWLPNKIAAYCTGAAFSKRKLFSDDEEVEIKPQSFLAVTTRNPASFRRDDVVDRLLILRLERFEDQFLRVERLMEQIAKDRGKLLGEYLYYVNRIVEEIRDGAIDPDRRETHRMADFAALIRIVGRIFGWSEEEIEDLMAVMQAERDMFAAEDDPTISILHTWLATKPQMGRPWNIGLRVSASQLFQILSDYAKAQNIKWLMSARALSERLKMSYIQREFIIETTFDGSEHYYRIWRKTDAKLESVPDEPDSEPLKFKAEGDE